VEKADKVQDSQEGSNPEGDAKPPIEASGKDSAPPPPEKGSSKPPKRNKGSAQPPPIPPEAKARRKKAKDAKGPPEPPEKAPVKKQAAKTTRSEGRSIEQKNMFEISRKASQRVEERLRDHLREKTDGLTEGYEVSFTISASDVTGNFEHSGIVESVTMRYGPLNKWHLSDSSALNIESAKQPAGDPALKAFYDGLLIYKEIGLTVPPKGGS